MGNALPEVRAAARLVVRGNAEGGAVEAIEQILAALLNRPRKGANAGAGSTDTRARVEDRAERGALGAAPRASTSTRFPNPVRPKPSGSPVPGSGTIARPIPGRSGSPAKAPPCGVMPPVPARVEGLRPNGRETGTRAPLALKFSGPAGEGHRAAKPGTSPGRTRRLSSGPAHGDVADRCQVEDGPAVTEPIPEPNCPVCSPVNMSDAERCAVKLLVEHRGTAHACSDPGSTDRPPCRSERHASASPAPADTFVARRRAEDTYRLML